MSDTSSLPTLFKSTPTLPCPGARLANAAASHDVILSTGGASRGEEDHIIEAMGRLGRRHLWQLAIKPGRPMGFGQIGDTVFFGLPGNPVASFVCFLLYVRPSLLRLAGAHWSEPQRHFAPARFAIPKKKKDRREFWRGTYSIDGNGKPGLDKFEQDGSGLITGLRESNCLIDIPEDVASVREGEMLAFIPYAAYGLS